MGVVAAAPLLRDLPVSVRCPDVATVLDARLDILTAMTMLDRGAHGWRQRHVVWCVVLVGGLAIGPRAPVTGAQADTYDVVLRGGRVIDPETGLDAVRNIGVRGDRIVEITGAPLQGRDVVDVSGLVVAPGFIDLHAHGQTNQANEFQAHDGVTTALELESG